MAIDRIPAWLRPGFGEIAAARIEDGVLEVEFGNGDRRNILLPSLGINVDVGTPIIIEEGLSIRLGTGEQAVNIGWMRIRSETDPTFAAHLQSAQHSELARVGRRLRALREDSGLSRAALARAAGLPISRLSRIENGEEIAHVPVLRDLLEALGAPFGDIAGPGAPEVSLRTLTSHAEKAGVPRELGAALVRAVPRRSAPNLLARAFAWSREAVVSGIPQTPRVSGYVQFKASPGPPPIDSPLVHLALSAARLARPGFQVPAYRPVPNNVEIIRREAADVTGTVSLGSLLDWTWSHGIPVLPLVGRGQFAAAVVEVDDAPVIVVKEARELAVFWLFDIAHELGHIALGHVQQTLIDVQSPEPDDQAIRDAEEWAATEFALNLLLPNYQSLLQEVRDDARGDRVQFKFAVERVAYRAHVSSAMLGIVAAHALTELGRQLDRWGSATNLAKPDGSGRETTRAAASQRATLAVLSELDAALIRTAVLSSASGTDAG